MIVIINNISLSISLLDKLNKDADCLNISDIKFDDIYSKLSQEKSDVIQMSKDLIRIAESGVEDVWGQEQVLWSRKLRYAGRTDMVGIWKGKPTIIDFKTSKKKKYESQIKDYFIQCCAYAVAHNELYGTGIRNIAVLVTVADGEPQIFEKDAVPYLPFLKNRRIEFDRLG